MSRGAVGETVTVRPTNNVYTALAGAAVIIQIIGLLVLFLRADSVGGLF
jgi:hypothetical protein